LKFKLSVIPGGIKVLFKFASSIWALPPTCFSAAASLATGGLAAVAAVEAPQPITAVARLCSRWGLANWASVVPQAVLLHSVSILKFDLSILGLEKRTVFLQACTHRAAASSTPRLLSQSSLGVLQVSKLAVQQGMLAVLYPAHLADAVAYLIHQHSRSDSSQQRSLVLHDMKQSELCKLQLLLRCLTPLPLLAQVSGAAAEQAKYM
jgi:hypothetical protein